MTTAFETSIATALHDVNLTGALGRFSEAYRISRAKAYEGIDFEAVRDQIAQIKSSASSHFEALVDQFTQRAESRGAKVFRTAEPSRVKQYILDLAREKGVERVVKSKSMASEEIHLNAALEQAGIEVDETDLGEWIIQLAHQTPSHMVMPAIHMTKEKVAEVFSQEVEEGQAPDIPTLVEFARAKLRPRFLQAEMGITGANIAVAESGSLVIVTNEGNARLVATLPRIHVAIVGMITTADLPVRVSQAHVTGQPTEAASFVDRVTEFERALIVEALDHANGVQTRAARALGMSERHLRYKLQKYHLNAGSAGEAES
jgi:L-lactate dehydrogenase complex protein LldF